MTKRKRLGFIAIEVVITASFILAVGFFALLNFSTSGTSLMDTVNGRLAGLGIFGGGTDNGEILYDSNGYPEILNVDPANISPADDFTWAWNEGLGGWTITGYTNWNRSDVIIPATKDGSPVVEIGIESFMDLTWSRDPITSVAIPNSVRRIQDYAFSYSNITDVVIPGSVEHLGWAVFQYATSLEVVTFLPNDGLTQIGREAFDGTSVKTLVLPNSITSIEQSSFRYHSLDSVTLPSSLLVIEYEAFTGNGGTIANLVIPEGVTTIKGSSFMFNQMQTLELPSTLTFLGTQAFGDNSLTSVIFNGPPPTIEDGTQWMPSAVFINNPLGVASISVPSQYLSDYQALALKFGVEPDRFIGR